MNNITETILNIEIVKFDGTEFTKDGYITVSDKPGIGVDNCAI